MNGAQNIWLAAGLRTPFVHVDGPFAQRDSLGAIGAGRAGDGGAGRGPSISGSGARWFRTSPMPISHAKSGLMPSSTRMCRHSRPSCNAAPAWSACFEAAGMLGTRQRALAMVGGVESMTPRADRARSQTFSVWLRQIVSGAQHVVSGCRCCASLRPSDIRLFVPEVKNRVTGRSMGEHTEDMAKDWKIGRQEQDELALARPQARGRGAGSRLLRRSRYSARRRRPRIMFPRRDTSLEKLAKLKPAFDRTSGQGTLTAGNSSPLTDGAAAIWVATDDGLSRLPDETPRVKLIDFEMAAVDIFTEGLLMAPVSAIPRLLARNKLKYDDIACGKSTKRFRRRCCATSRRCEDPNFVRQKAGVENTFGSFPRERMNPNGGSVALGHPFARDRRANSESRRSRNSRRCRRAAARSSASAPMAAWGRWRCCRIDGNWRARGPLIGPMMLQAPKSSRHRRHCLAQAG